MSSIVVENKNFDLNSLFNISHSFEVLKEILKVIVKSNKDLSFRVDDLEEEIHSKTISINNLNKELLLEKEINNKLTLEIEKSFKLVKESFKKIDNKYMNLTETMNQIIELNNEKFDNEKYDDENSKYNKIESKDSNENKLNTNDLKEDEYINNKEKIDKVKDIDVDKFNTKSNKKIKVIIAKTEKSIDFDNLSNFKEADKEQIEYKVNQELEKKYIAEKALELPKKKITEDGAIERYSSKDKIKKSDITDITNNTYEISSNINDKLEKINNIQLKSEELIFKLNKRVNVLENEIESINYNIKSKKASNDFNNNLENKHQQNNLNAYTRDINKQLEELRNNIQGIELNNITIKEKLEDVIIKQSDFNIIEALKMSNDNPDFNIIYELIKNTEKKFLKKFEFTDEKQRKLEEEQNKFKNDIMKAVRDIDILSIENSSLKKDTENTSFELLKLQKTLSLFEDSFNNSSGDGKDKQNLLSDIQKKVEDVLLVNKNSSNLKLDDKETKEQILLMIKNIIDNNGSSLSSNTKLEIELNKLNEKLQKKTGDLDKKINILSSSLNMEKINIEFNKINDAVSRKINLDEFSELKSTTNLLTHQINYFKDTITQLIEDRRVLDDINWLRRKVENLTNNMNTMKNIDDSGNNANSRAGYMAIEAHKYLEISNFNMFLKNYKSDMEFLRKNMEEYKNIINDLVLKDSEKVNEKDLKTLEDYLVVKIEESRLGMIKKFADKIDTLKSIKYIEAQLKHIIEIYVKKMDRGDNWLLAKKPIGGYSCASCENYIGELTDKHNDHAIWNKYPSKETNEKAYKVRS